MFSQHRPVGCCAECLAGESAGAEGALFTCAIYRVQFFYSVDFCSADLKASRVSVEVTLTGRLFQSTMVLGMKENL